MSRGLVAAGAALWFACSGPQPDPTPGGGSGGGGIIPGIVGDAGAPSSGGSGGVVVSPPPGGTLFPASAPWYQDISRAPLDAQSAQVINGLQARGGWGTGQLR